jgi:hypothetical protein
VCVCVCVCVCCKNLLGDNKLDLVLKHSLHVFLPFLMFPSSSLTSRAIGLEGENCSERSLVYNLGTLGWAGSEGCQERPSCGFVLPVMPRLFRNELSERSEARPRWEKSLQSDQQKEDLRSNSSTFFS